MPRLAVMLLSALIMMLSPIDGARTYIVDDDGFANYKTIGEAVVAASNGDTIYIKPGTYHEEVLLNKSLSLMPLSGEDEPIVLVGDGLKTGITIASDGCSIDGLTLQNYTGPGIEIQSSGNTIKNGRFEKDDPGIMARNSHGNTIVNNLLKDCEGGIVLWTDSKDNLITENELQGGTVSLYLREVSNNSVIGNRIAGSSMGIWLMDCGNNAIEGNDVSAKTYGIWLLNSSNARLADNHVLLQKGPTISTSGIYLLNASGIEASGNDIAGAMFGIGVFDSRASKLNDNTVAGSDRGIYMLNSSDQEVNNHSISDVEYGIVLENSSRNIVYRCTIVNSTRALGLGMSSANNFTENRISNCRDTAIEVVDHSDHNRFFANEISRGDKGIIILDSPGNRMEANVLRDIDWGLYVEGQSKESFNNLIDQSNLINGRPIAYYYGQSGRLVADMELAHLTLAYCDNFTVQKNSISSDALFLFGSRGNKILENNVSHCFGMRLLDCTANEISGNQLIGNRYSGLFLVGSDANRIVENNLSLNQQNGVSLFNCRENIIRENNANQNRETGIWINLSNDNLIYRNNITSNPVGLDVIHSSGNRIYHNNFIDNKEQAKDINGDNLWDMGNVTGGNYWSGHVAKGNPSRNWSRMIKGGKLDSHPFQDISGWNLADAAVSSGIDPENGDP